MTSVPCASVKAAQRKSVLLVLVALPDSGQIQNKTFHWAITGNLITRDHFGCVIRVVDQNWRS